MRPTGPRSVWRCWRPCPEAGRARALTVPLCVPRAVSCHCDCGASGPASSWYHGLTKCPKGAATPQEWLDTFQLKEAAGKPAKGKGKKNAEASSKASTPTKDGENAENAAVDEEPKVCLCVDMRAHIHAQCCCALRPVLPGRSRRRHCPPAPAPPSGVARAGWRLRALARARAQL